MIDSLVLLKWSMAAVFLYHGLTKNARSFGAAFKLPMTIAFLVMVAEVLGGLGYLVDPLTDQTIFGYTPSQLASLAVIPVLLGAIWLVHGKKGFNVMNGGYEYQMVLLAVAFYLFTK